MIKSRILLVFVATFMITMPSFAQPIVPHKADRATVEKFLPFLTKYEYPDNYSNVTLKIREYDKDYIYISTKFPPDKEEIPSIHNLWIADVNNDGKQEYFWTSEGEGSGHFDYFDIFQIKPDGTLANLDFPLKNIPSNIGNPPLNQDAKGITYISLTDIWAENNKGEKIQSGATSNAAKDLACLVVVESEYRWDKNGLKLVYKQTSRTTYDVVDYK